MDLGAGAGALGPRAKRSGDLRVRRESERERGDWVCS